MTFSPHDIPSLLMNRFGHVFPGAQVRSEGGHFVVSMPEPHRDTALGEVSAVYVHGQTGDLAYQRAGSPALREDGLPDWGRVFPHLDARDPRAIVSLVESQVGADLGGYVAHWTPSAGWSVVFSGDFMAHPRYRVGTGSDLAEAL